MHKLTAAAALAAAAQPAAACDTPPSPEPTGMHYVMPKQDARYKIAMPACPDCHYHLLDTRS